jgi:mono/diheme cytochrome c family protein
MTRRRAVPARLVSLVLAAAGCGGDDDEGGGNGGGGGGGGATETQQAGSPQETFASTCGGCHTLAAAETEGQVGPNLDDLKPDQNTVREAIRQGPGVMPENLLDGEQADAVAQYVADNAGG